MKILITLALLIILTGCVAWTPVKYAANQVCGTSTTAVMSQNAVTRIIGDLPSILDAINGEVV